MKSADHFIRRAAGVLFAIASLGAAFLVFVSLKNGPVSGCGSGSSCGDVLRTRWAYVLPNIPVSAPALVIYLSLLSALAEKNREGVCKSVLQVGAILVIGAGIWFVGIQLFLLKTVCKYCMATHLAGTAGAACILFRIHPLRKEIALPRLGLAGAGLAALALCQIFIPQKMTAHTRLGGAGFSSSGQIVALGGLELDLGRLPHRGNPQAERKILVLFDYTCASCRVVHQYLADAEARFGKGNYLLVMMPVPLHPDCNTYFSEVIAQHENACLYAAIALVLWHSDPEKFRTFDRWLVNRWTLGATPVTSEVRAKAEELIGVDKLTTSLMDPRIKEQQESLTVFWNAVKSQTGRATMPKILIGNGSIIEGMASSESVFFDELERRLGQ